MSRVTLLHRRDGPGVLARIAERTAQDVSARAAVRPRRDLEDAVQAAVIRFPVRSLRAALRPGRVPADDGPRLIAEFKPRSPSRGELRPGARIQDVVAAYAPFAAAVSVLADAPFFGGSHELHARARRAAPGRPVLWKDFVLSAYQLSEARACGADAVLLMAALLPATALEALLAQTHELGMEALVEAHDDDELDVALACGAELVGVNSRDLRTLDIDRDAQHRLLERIPADRVRVAESGVTEPEHRDALVGLADAALIGSELMVAEDVATRIVELGFGPLF
jgi:indole-3-glycerol phosphate synthase